MKTRINNRLFKTRSNNDSLKRASTSAPVAYNRLKDRHVGPHESYTLGIIESSIQDKAKGRPIKTRFNYSLFKTILHSLTSHDRRVAPAASSSLLLKFDVLRLEKFQPISTRPSTSGSPCTPPALCGWPSYQSSSGPTTTTRSVSRKSVGMSQSSVGKSLSQ